jgi:hypothetical protein
MSRASLLVACALTAFVSAPIVQASVISYTLDPAQSKLTLSGSVNSSPFAAQQLNTDMTSYAGSIQVDRGANTIQFVAGSAIDAAPLSETNIAPDRMAHVGSADLFFADYAVQAPLEPLTFPFPDDTSTGYFTFFDLVFAAVSNSLPVNAGNFAANGVTLQFTTGFYAYVQFGDITENVGKFGTPTLVGKSAVNGAATGSLSTSAGVETLTLPVNLTFTSNNPDGINVTFTLTGNLVATAPVPEPSGAAILSASTAGLLLTRKLRSRRGGRDR